MKQGVLTPGGARGEYSEKRNDGRYAAVKQYSLAGILIVWAAAAVPMGVLAWGVAPWLSGRLKGVEPLGQALLIVFTAGLVWQFLLVLLLTWRELGGLQWARVREAWWLQAPREPKSGRVGGPVWLWALLLVVLVGLWQAVPAISPPSSRDMTAVLASKQGAEFFRGAWGWFAVIVVQSIFNTVLGEELLFRGFLLPRMRGVFGRADWVANGVLFATYHLHEPWRIPSVLADMFLLAYPSRRFQSAWMGIIAHSVQSVVIVIVVLTLVLA